METNQSTTVISIPSLEFHRKGKRCEMLPHIIVPMLVFIGLLASQVGCRTDMEVWTKKYKDGTKREEYQFFSHPKDKRRIRHGSFRSYHPGGELAEVGRYKEGKQEGKWVRYYRNGQVFSEGIYKIGKREGRWLYYPDDTGEGQDEDIYKNGECVSRCEGEWSESFWD